MNTNNLNKTIGDWFMTSARVIILAMFWVTLMFSLMFGLQGCAIWGIELGVHRTVTVEKSPYRVVLSGDVQKEDYDNAKDILNFLHNQKYRDRNFTDITVNVHGSQNTQHSNYYQNQPATETDTDTNKNEGE